MKPPAKNGGYEAGRTHSSPARLQASILDRLMDQNSTEKFETMGCGPLNVFQFRAAIARDLESLLNSRSVDAEEFRARYPLASSSVLFYGIRDLSGLSLLDSSHQVQLRDQIQRAITRFEPRLAQVRVAMELHRELDRRLRFRVEAILRIHPARPSIVLEAWLHHASSRYRFSEAG